MKDEFNNWGHYLPYRSKEEIGALINNGLVAKGWMFNSCGSDYPPFTEDWCELLSSGMGLKFKDGLSVIDLGCGYGRFLNYLAIKNINQFTYYGLEVPSDGNGDVLIPFNKEHYETLNSGDKKIYFGFIDDEDMVNDAIENCDTLLLSSVFTHITIEDSIEVLKKYEKILEKENGSVVFSLIEADSYSLHAAGSYGYDEGHAVVTHTSEEIEMLTLNGKYQIEKIADFQTAGVISTGKGSHKQTIYKLYEK